MTEAEPTPGPSPGPAIEDLVRAHLLRQAETISTQRLQSRIYIGLAAARRYDLRAAAARASASGTASLGERPRRLHSCSPSWGACNSARSARGPRR